MARTSRFFVCGAGLLVAGALAGARPAWSQEVLSAEGSTSDVRIEIRELSRGDGGTVTLRLRLVNESGDPFDASCDMRESGNDSCGDFTGAYLLDPVNKKKYLVVRDADGVCVCSNIDNVEDGKRMNLWATYLAPPADVQKVTVIVPRFEPIDGVPITGP
jgi:hypothetical protein